MRSSEFIVENVLDEAPLPPDWDASQYAPGTTFKQRLAYALERAAKLGTGSSRVATTIEYQGRPTVLKIAKNRKGLAQNAAEASILDDGYASRLGILIPFIDCDQQNVEPTWIQTELAKRALEGQLCRLMGCRSLMYLVQRAQAIHHPPKYPLPVDGATDEELVSEYADTLAELESSFNVELGDFARAANWGIYNGKPVIIDVGFTKAVQNKYYNRLKF